MKAIKLLAVALIFSISTAEGSIYFLERPLVLRSSDLIEYETHRPEGILRFVKSDRGDYTIMIKQESPVSVKSIESKIKLLGAEKESLHYKTLGPKGGTVFGFRNKEGQLHFFSTKGGYLQVTPKKGDASQTVALWLARFER